MSDLIEFLRARLDEDERVAHKVPGGVDNHRWHWRVSEEDVVPAEPRGNDYIAVGPWSSGVGEPAEHIARHDPARVLREVDAKRRILDEYERALERRKRHPDDLASAGALLTMLHVAKMLAPPYADHPEYREEWRP